MAATATRSAAKSTRKRPPARPPAAAKKATAKTKRAGSAAKSTAKAAPRAAKKAKKAAPTPGGLAGKLAMRVARKVGSSALHSGLEMLRHVAERAAAAGGEAVEGGLGRVKERRLPIQRSIDVAVPLRVAWEEWMTLESLPEGAHSVTDIERDGSELTGRTTGARRSEWSAEVLDERDRQSFAWQSHEGSDCAGLITFHELSRRLTRIELNLDVVPTGIAETVQLATRLADHRAETELRRFKARLELINPDLYEEDTEEDEVSEEDTAEEADDTGTEDD